MKNCRNTYFFSGSADAESNTEAQWKVEKGTEGMT